MSRVERDCKDGAGEIEFYYLDVIAFRELSRMAAEKLDVSHQSPQLLMIKNGKCVYHASHLFISLNAAVNSLREAA